MKYLLKRLCLIPPTLFLILLANFTVVQLAPSGPIETALNHIKTEQKSMMANGFSIHNQISYQGSDGLSEQMVNELNARFGFDKPPAERFWLMIKNYAKFELGESFFKGESVSTLIGQKLPLTMLFGTLCLTMMYVFGVILGIIKAKYHGNWFDKISTISLSILYSLPAFVIAVVLIMLFAGSRYFHFFPMQVSLGENMASLTFFTKIKTIVHELFLPVLAGSIGGAIGVAFLTKFSIMSQLNLPYIATARAYGQSDWFILKHHVLKNALLPILSEMPAVIIGFLFMGNFMLEVIFGIDGMGRLGYEAVLNRDYPVVFGVLYVFTLLSVALQLIFDLCYQLIDVRVDYS